MNWPLALCAVVEAVTGLALMISPAVVSSLLLGEGVEGTGIAVGRVAGVALLSLGLACWPGRDPANPFAAPRLAMLTYNVLVSGYRTFLGIAGQSVGILLWPATAIHGVLATLLVRDWHMAQQTQKSKG